MTQNNRPRYGFIGLGHLGGHLAANLIRGGFEVTVHDLSPAVARPHMEAGAVWAESPAEAAARSNAVITCLPSPAASTEVMTAANGVLRGLTAGGTWIEMSTNDRHEITRIAALAEETHVSTLEAPVTGGIHRAAAGEITVLVGGSEALYRTHLPAFEAMGGEVMHMGPLGSASAIKVITNMLAFIHLLAAGEALMLARRSRIDLAKAFEAIKASSGNSFVHETESQLILNGSYNVGFTMALACKDLGFATKMGRELGVPLELAELTEQIFLRAREKFGARAWSTMAVKLLEDALNTPLRAPGFPAVLS